MNRWFTAVAVPCFLLLCETGLLAAPATDNGVVRVTPTGGPGAWTGFRLSSSAGPIATVTFGSNGDLTAATVERTATTLRFGRLRARPTPRLGPGSMVEVKLLSHDPFPQVFFRLELQTFDRTAWERVHGEVPFHFLCCSLPGAELFHQRGWPIATPVLDPYPMHTCQGPGKQVVSLWSREWTNAPPFGASPVPVVGLWKMTDGRYVGYDFHGARLTDHSEKLLGSSYCFKHRKAREFFTLVWPYAKQYRLLRYPEKPAVVASHFRLLHSNALYSDDDPNLFVTQFVWKTYANKLPAAPPLNDLSWLPGDLRPKTFPRPRLGRLYFVDGKKARWMTPGSITATGVSYFSPIDYAYEKRLKSALAQLKRDLDFLLPRAKRWRIGDDECVFWRKPVVGEGAKMFGPGVPTLHNVQGWGMGLALLDMYRNEPRKEGRLLPYIDGVLRWTKHIGYTRNGYPDVPAAEFAWGATPAATFCLRYYYTFRADPHRRELAQSALKLARTMTYRYLAIWTSDSEDMDALDSSFFMEPNAGHSWLGCACSNEVWVVCVALAEVYVATGDPVLAYYLRGMLERWHELYREDYADSITAYRSANLTERYGLFDECAQGKGVRGDFGGIWGGFEKLAWPIGDAVARIICGEQGALAFDKDGLHTNIADYRCTEQGFSFRVTPAQTKAPEPLTLVVTFPFFDLRGKPVTLSSGVTPNVSFHDEQPASVTIAGIRYGDTVTVGRVSKNAPPIPCSLVKTRRLSTEPVHRESGFKLINLAPVADTLVERDWNDPHSFAGLEPGRRLVYGVPFEIVSPLLNGGRAAVRNRAVSVRETGSLVFLLVGDATPGGVVRVSLAGGEQRVVPATNAVPVLRGWPPLFTWHLDLLAVRTGGRPVEGVAPDGVSLFALTVTTKPPSAFGETFARLDEQRRKLAAEREAVKRLRALKARVTPFAGHLAVLPNPTSKPAHSPVARALAKAGIADAFTFLTPAQLVDPNFFTASRFWVTFNLGGEDFYQTVHRPGDAEAALRAYLASGGTLVAMTSQPFPFYYNEEGKPVVSAPRFGLPICGSGARDRLRGPVPERLRGWEEPPPGVRLSFHVNPEAKALPSLPATFPFPTEGERRWRPLVNLSGGRGVYTPWLTLRDSTGRSYGDGAASIEYTSGPLRSGRVVYVWGPLAARADLAPKLISDVMATVLSTTLPPPRRTVCTRTRRAPTLDGELTEAVWRQAVPLPLNNWIGHDQPPAQTTTARLLWDAGNLYVGVQCQDQDIFATKTKRDDRLWEDHEVVEIYLDPDADGKNYKEFEVNPLNAVIDLNIPDAKTVGDLAHNIAWNAAGLRTAVRVTGTLHRRTDRDSGWTVEMVIPFAAVSGRAPRVGDAWRMNLYRYDNQPFGKEPFRLSAWSRVRKWPHEPTRFGTLVFGANPYHDDFSLYPPGSTGAPTWSPTAGAWRVRDGVYQGTDCLVGGWQAAGASTGAATWTDYTFRCRFRLLERGSDHRDGVWFGIRHADDRNSYSVNFQAGNVQLHKVSRGVATTDDTPLAFAPWEPDNKWHRVEITVRGNHLTVVLDGKPLLAATDNNHLGRPPVPAGGVVLCARRWESSTGHTRVEFDDVEVVPR